MQELRFADGPLEVVVLPEIGARLHSLRAFGRDLLRTPADPGEHLRDPFFWGGYVMAPWCNRVAAEPVDLGARRIDLASNFPDGTAIHGQVYARPWEVLPDRSLRVAGGGDGWPWTYEVRLSIQVVGPSVRMELALSNRSGDPMPAGIGLHPWFLRPCLLAIRAEEVHPDNLATQAWPEPVHGPFDRRRIGALDPDLDATWTGLGEPPVELAWPEAGVRATMRIEAATRFVVAASPHQLDAIAVEAQTHAPQGLRRLLRGEPGGLALLEPGGTIRLGVEMAFWRLGEGDPTD